MEIVLLAAGRGKRLNHMTEEIPKPFIKINDVPIIERLLRQLSKHKEKFNSVNIVTGYKHEIFNSLISKYTDLNIKLIYNEEWETKNNAFSFLKGVEKDKDVLVIESDGIFENVIIDKVFEDLTKKENILFGDNIQGYEGSRLLTDENNKIINMKIIREIEREKVMNCYKSIGIMKIGKKMLNELVNNIENANESKYNWYLDNFISELVEKHNIYVSNINQKKWTEIDTEEDYKRAQKIFGESI